MTQIRLGDASSTSTSSSSTTVVTYEVVISAHNPDLKLKPRLTANVTIYTLDRKDVLSVPARALRFTPEKPLIGDNDIVKDCEGEHKIWTREGNTFTAHPVQIGITNGINTEITQGASEGMVVVTEAPLEICRAAMYRLKADRKAEENKVRLCLAIRAARRKENKYEQNSYRTSEYQT